MTYENQLLEVKQRIFNWLIPLLMGAICLSVIVSNGVAGVPSTGTMALWFSLSVVFGFSYLLKYRTFPLAVRFFFIGTTLCTVIAVYTMDGVGFLSVFAFLVLVAVFLLSRLESIGYAVLASLLLIRPIYPAETGSEALVSLLFIWVALMIGSIIRDGLFDIVDMLETHQRYILQQIHEARERRAILAQHSKALDEASQNLHHTNNHLRQARQAAEEAHRLKSQFAANVSHELRTPINLIVGFTEMIVNAPDTYGTPLPVAYWTDVNTIYRNARHLQSLINDVLDISQLEASQMAIVKEAVNVSALIHETADMLYEQTVRKGLAFHVKVQEPLPTLWLDRVRIRQVIINLIGNALRFTDEGAITLSAQLDQDRVLICIADTGIGIPPQEIDRIFEEFHQLDNSMSRRYGGSGLGLTLSKQFVELHQGSLYATSEGIAGKGSQFYIEFPLSHRQTQLTYHHPTRPTAQADPCFVVLDSDPIVIQLFERYSTKHPIIGATYSEGTLQWLKTLQPIAVVADAEYINQLEPKALSELGKVSPIISCPMPSGRRMMQKFGVTDYLVKPVSAVALGQAIEQMRLTVRSILIVDDDPEIVRLFDRMLRSMNKGYVIRKAYSGLEGLALMRSSPPDLVILDLLMPNVDGLAVIQHMKHTEALANIPVVMVSARGASEAITPVSNGRLSVYKAEGFQPMELIRCVESLVDSLSVASSPKSSAVPADRAAF